MKTVTNIEYTNEEKEVYDLSVNEDHSYIANGIMSHNSAMAVNFAMRAALWGARTAILSLEMTEEQVALRQTAFLSGIDMGRLQRKELNESDKQFVLKKYKEFTRKCKKKNSVCSIRAPEEDISMEEALFLLKPYAYDIIVIDYVGLLKGMDADDQWKKLGSACRFAKRFAMANNNIVIVCAQVSEEGLIRYSKAMKEHCVTGDTKVYVNKQLRTVKDLADEYVPTRDGIGVPCQILTATGERRVEKFYSFGLKNVIRIKTSRGEIGVSESTPLLTLNKNEDLEWIKAKDLDKNEHKVIQKINGILNGCSISCRNKSTESLFKKYDLEPLSIESLSKAREDVYDFTVYRTEEGILGEGHFIANDIVVHNSNYFFSWVYDDEAKESGIIEVQQQKNRNSKAFPFKLKVDFSTMTFDDVTEEEEQSTENRHNTKRSSKKKYKDEDDDPVDLED